MLPGDHEPAGGHVGVLGDGHLGRGCRWWWWWWCDGGCGGLLGDGGGGPHRLVVEVEELPHEGGHGGVPGGAPAQVSHLQVEVMVKAVCSELIRCIVFKVPPPRRR